ncbi:hypothetical protein [Aquimarina hainanensis]|uniref:hypothetical protein n=1 Tax=Aquimarina hainanensis TaxID=1578017 RepID=UPI00362083F8
MIFILIYNFSHSQTERINLNAHGQGLKLTNSADIAGTYISFTDHDGKSANISSFDDNYTDSNYRNALQFFARNGKDFKFATSPNGNSGTNKFVILNNGNIGIGTSNPIQKLDINGGLKLNLNTHGQGIRLTNNTNNAGTYITFTDHDGKSANISSFDDNYTDSNYRNALQFFARNGKDFKFATSPNGNSGTNKFVIRNNGNIGIGTTNPDMKLTVNGDIHAKEVKIDLNIAAPDYVFKKDYRLRSINEVEKFIKKNNHLPEIPSAKEFEQNGIMQAEMDMKLLKKIEELTLYTIQQQKEIEKLKLLVTQLIASKK